MDNLVVCLLGYCVSTHLKCCRRGKEWGPRKMEMLGTWTEFWMGTIGMSSPIRHVHVWDLGET